MLVRGIKIEKLDSKFGLDRDRKGFIVENTWLHIYLLLLEIDLIANFINFTCLTSYKSKATKSTKNKYLGKAAMPLFIKAFLIALSK